MPSQSGQKVQRAPMLCGSLWSMGCAASTWQTGESDVLAYAIPDALTDSKAGLFLKFDGDKLAEIASTKVDVTSGLYRKYLSGLLAQTEEWIAAGMTPLLENSENDSYIYTDDRTVASVSGGKMPESKRFYVTASFTEKTFWDSQKRRSVN